LPSLTASPDLRIALTGATGFVGSRLQARLLARPGRDVTALVRPARNSSSEQAPDTRREELLDGITQVGFDHAHSHEWRRLIEGQSPDVIILLAGAVRGRTYNDFAAVNVAPVAALASALAQVQTNALPRVLLISSLAASAPHLSHYAASKKAGEDALHNLPTRWTVLRPPAIYGPGDKELAGLFTTIRRGLLPRPGPADQHIPLLHVDDLTRAVDSWLITPDKTSGEIHALHDGHNDGAPAGQNGYSWPEMAAALRGNRPVVTLPVHPLILRTIGSLNTALAGLLRYQPILSAGKARELGYTRWLCDNRAFTAATGWQPEIALQTGSACYFE